MSKKLNLLTLNSNGLRDKNRQNRLAAFCDSECIDIICLQETHLICPRDFVNLKLLFKCIDYRFSGLDSYSCGVAIFVRNNCNFKFSSSRIDFEGRLVSIDIVLHELRIRIVNIYAPNTPSARSRFFYALANYLEGPFDALFILGDFNCVLDPIMDREGGVYTVDRSSDVLMKLINDLGMTDIWRKLHPHTRQ